jgi:HEAT repeat protein
VEPLIALLKDPDPEVCVGALSMLRSCRDPRVVAPVSAILRSSADWWVRSLAAEILGGVPGEEITKLLLDQVADPELCFSVLHVLGTRGGPAARQALLDSLNSSERAVRCVVLDIFRRTKDLEALSAVAFVAERDADFGVRERALEALREYGGAAAAELRRLDQYAATAATAETESDATNSELQMVNVELNRA